MGTIGLGWFEVRGRRRVPCPPAMTTAFTATSRRIPHAGLLGTVPVFGRIEQAQSERQALRNKEVGTAGFEPATFRPPAGCATKLRHVPTR